MNSLCRLCLTLLAVASLSGAALAEEKAPAPPPKAADNKTDKAKVELEKGKAKTGAVTAPPKDQPSDAAKAAYIEQQKEKAAGK